MTLALARGFFLKMRAGGGEEYRSGGLLFLVGRVVGRVGGDEGVKDTSRKSLTRAEEDKSLTDSIAFAVSLRASITALSGRRG